MNDTPDPAPESDPESHGSRFPRLRGAVMFGTGAALVAFTLYLRVVAAKAICIAPVFLFYGAWVMVVGEPIDKTTGQPAGWAQVGAWLFGLLGIIVAAIIAAMLG